MSSSIAFSAWFIPGLSAAIAIQLIVSFAVGWHLRGRTFKTAEAAPIPEPESIRPVLEALRTLAVDMGTVAAQHTNRVAEINDELRGLLAKHNTGVIESVLETGGKLVEANERLQGRFVSLLFEIQKREQEIRVERNAYTAVPPEESIGLAEIRKALSEVEVSALSRLATTNAARRSASLDAESCGGVALATEFDDEDTTAADFIERRESPRQPFPYTQYIAAYRQGEVLSPSQFEKVRCHDLSATGFSFWIEAPPEYRFLVVRFGAPPEFMYLTAEVMHTTKRSRDGRVMFVVGCKFLERVSL